ncbi:hypothetical protein NDU88_003082 [Pleurodeles waltl]|uniref:Uncharacterized protein n=1 Tax=Pleurodeles waltl TaxID=8319 RepID=A0AAV7PFY6_PLEWA|nr:hypothetical protein NDU88_003082 [Pleurodeles waltl]
MQQLFTTPPGAKWQPATVMPQRSLGLVAQGPPGSVELFPWSGNAATFHHTPRCKMAAGGCNAAKESEACGSGLPGSVELVLRSGYAATFSQRKMVQNRRRWLYYRKGVWGLWFGPQ